MKSRPKGLGWIIALLGIAFVATLAYWIVFFTSGDVQVRTDDVYIAFEKAFPPADAWMALCAFLGAIGLWRRRSWGFLFALLAASSSIFLGLMDLTFNLNQSIYAVEGAETLIEFLINLATLLLGPVIIVYLWKNRRQLL